MHDRKRGGSEGTHCHHDKRRMKDNRGLLERKRRGGNPPGHTWKTDDMDGRLQCQAQGMARRRRQRMLIDRQKRMRPPHVGKEEGDEGNGPERNTRRQGTEKPSKIDLIFTNAKAKAFPPQEVVNSNHRAIAAKVEEWTGKEETERPKTSYKGCDWQSMEERMEKKQRPRTAEKFQGMMDKAIRELPKVRGDGQNRLLADLLRLRRDSRMLARQKEKHEG